MDLSLSLKFMYLRPLKTSDQEPWLLKSNDPWKVSKVTLWEYNFTIDGPSI
jgi:hypothetical protein